MRSWRFIIGLLISAGFLFYAFRGQDYGAIVDALRGVNYWLLLPALILYTLGVVTFVVDVSAVWEVKERALDAYETQLHQAGREPRAAAPTKVASPEFRLAIAGRARHFGLMINAAYGEPFWSPLPLAVRDPLQILPAGLR